MPVDLLHILSGLSGRLLGGTHEEPRLLLKSDEQIKRWHKANRRMKWGLTDKDFARIPPRPQMTSEQRQQGYWGSALFYGFGDDGHGFSDSVLSGRRAWRRARKIRSGAIWQCQYADFDRPQDIRLRPGAPPRPKGFYWAAFHPGDQYRDMPVAKRRKELEQETGAGPEAFQLLCVTHPHLAEAMNQGRISYWALADYDIAPHGYNDFFEAPQIFCSQDTLGLGVGNVDGPYPMFAIPKIIIFREN